MELLICKVVFEDKKERSVCFSNFIILHDGYRHRPMDCTTRYAIYQYRLRLIGGGGIVGIAALIRSVIQDVAISNKRPCLGYGDTFVRKDSHKERGVEFREFTYLLEIKNETQNSQAEDCRSTIDLSSIGVSPFYGMWDITDEVAIPISHTELIQLFTKSEFSDGTPTRTSIIFPPRSKNGIMTTEKSVDSELLKKELKISIQSSSANFPKPRTTTLKEIMDSAKDI